MKRIGFIVVFVLTFGMGAAVIPEAQAGTGAARIVGKVVNVKAGGVKGAKVTVEGQSVTATTAADGSFRLVGVKPGSVYLYVSSPSDAYLDGETLKSLSLKSGASVSGVLITLSGRPSAAATYVGMKSCARCHEGKMFKALDGSPHAAAHSRFVTEGTSHLVYKTKWPEPGDKYLPRDTKGKLLKVQDPLDGEGMVNVALCTKGDGSNRRYLFKFYPEQKEGVSLAEADLDCSDKPGNAVWIPVAATIGGEGDWGEGYTDPDHKVADRSPNFDEGKQRYMCKIEDVPYIVRWMKENNVSRDGQKQDYIAFMPVFMMQYGTPEGSKVLAKGQVGAPMFWQKSPAYWCEPNNTLSRNCAGCHATGLQLRTQDFLGDPNPKRKFKSVVTYWDYKDLNITCERCHGPGSEHAAAGDKTKIIIPGHLTAKAGNEACGQCHGSHDAKSQRPLGIFKPPYDANYKDTLGNGFFVPGVYNLETFHVNLDQPSIKPNTLESDWKAGSFMAWPDRIHGRAHSMELTELRLSAHLNNTREKLTCYTCHDAHGLDAGPSSLKAGGYDFASPAYGNNTLCLACHATRGQFKNVTISDVAVLQLDAGRNVRKNGAAFTVQPADVFVSRDRVARAVARHMQAGAGMGGALYAPDDRSMPVGSCTSCHMAKIGKLTDLNVDAMYRLDFDKNGRSAVAEGGTSSHVFDIVWPGQSAVLKNPDPSKGHDYDIMPNSCGNCHAFARTSGDNH